MVRYNLIRLLQKDVHIAYHRCDIIVKEEMGLLARFIPPPWKIFYTFYDITCRSNTHD